MIVNEQLDNHQFSIGWSKGIKEYIEISNVFTAKWLNFKQLHEIVFFTDFSNVFNDFCSWILHPSDSTWVFKNHSGPRCMRLIFHDLCRCFGMLRCWISVPFYQVNPEAVPSINNVRAMVETASEEALRRRCIGLCWPYLIAPLIGNTQEKEWLNGSCTCPRREKENNLQSINLLCFMLVFESVVFKKGHSPLLRFFPEQFMIAFEICNAEAEMYWTERATGISIYVTHLLLKTFQGPRKKRQVWAGMWDYLHPSGFAYPSFGLIRCFFWRRNPEICAKKNPSLQKSWGGWSWASPGYISYIFGSSWSIDTSCRSRAMPCLVDFYVSRANGMTLKFLCFRKE